MELVAPEVMLFDHRAVWKLEELIGRGDWSPELAYIE
jgi:hypothetical protein